MTVATPVMVGMGEIHIARVTGQLVCLGLGSCIGLCAYDRTARVGGMIHVMLPEAFDGKAVEKPGKFADTGIVEMLRLLEKAGASRSRLRIAYGGGAQVFNFGGTGDGRLDIGARNTAAVAKHLKSFDLRVLATDTDGNLGRTVTFDVDSGLVRARTVSQGERVLCNLGV